MGRPLGYQWQPLGLGTDPVPGDPEAVSREAARLALMARMITGQIAALRKIASDNTEIGQHAEKIRSTALSLAGSLQAVAARYTRVSSALHGWAPELDQAQALSLRALNDAEAPYTTLSRTVMLPSGSHLSAAQEQEITGYHASMRRAQDQLDAAQALLTRATTLRDTQAAYYAAKISQASNDSLTDHESFWDRSAWLIRDISTGLEILATVAAVTAFVLAQFVPGLDLLVDTLAVAVLFASTGAAAGRFILADTHNGSWLDFGIDAFACLTFGSGRFLGTAAKTLAEQAEVASESAMVKELAAGTGAKAAELERFAGMMGRDVGELAERFAPRLAETAVKVAADNYELAGMWKIHANLGALSEEGSYFARALAVTTRFAEDMGSIGTLTKAALAASGVSAGLTSVTGAGALVGGGVEFYGPNGPTEVDVQIPGVSHWFRSTFETPAGGS